MVNAWRWLIRAVRCSPNAWLIVAGVCLIVLPPLFAAHAHFAAFTLQDHHGWLRAFLMIRTAIIGSSWFWFGYAAEAAIGAALILGGLAKFATPKVGKTETMRGMRESEKRPVWPWIVDLVIGFPVLYVLLFGPACWIAGDNEQGQSAVALPSSAKIPIRALYIPPGALA